MHEPMTADEIQVRLTRMKPWHHNVELAPGLWSNPRMGDHPVKRWQLIEPYVPQDLSGKTVLDVGCSSGYFSIKFKQRGAKRVIALDVVDSAIEEAHMLSDIFQTPIDIVQQDLYTFLHENELNFDYVIFLGLFYHLRDPIFALDHLKQITRERLYFQTLVRNDARLHNLFKRWLFAFYQLGVLIKQRTPGKAVRSAINTIVQPLSIPENITMRDSYLLSHPDFPKMYFIQRRMNEDSTNWWVGETASIRAILESSGFSCITQLSPDTFVCDY